MTLEISGQTKNMKDLHVISIGLRVNQEFRLSMFGSNRTHLHDQSNVQRNTKETAIKTFCLHKAKKKKTFSNLPNSREMIGKNKFELRRSTAQLPLVLKRVPRSDLRLNDVYLGVACSGWCNLSLIGTICSIWVPHCLLKASNLDIRPNICPGADRGFWSGGPLLSLTPGGHEPKICSKLPENCKIR